MHHLQVEAIANGTVIDHIPSSKGLKIIHRLQLKHRDIRLTVGLNLPSNAMGRKDLIKINQLQLTPEQAAEFALFAPHATINVIENYRVTHKYNMQKPDELKGLFQCPNSNCITHVEPIHSWFHVKQVSQHLKLRCHYCERSYSEDLFQ